MCHNTSKQDIDMRLHVKTSRLRGLPASLIHSLVEARHVHYWSQRELASKVGLPQAHISAIENGKVAPRFNTLLDLARILGFDLVLVPRSLVPAVQSLIRDSGQSQTTDLGEDERPLYGEGGGDDEP